ncbi:DUF4233 domain-containing protein [Schumannella luteola]
MTEAPAAAPVGKPRRERSATESLTSIALGLEAFMVFFATLTAFGLKALEPAPAFLGGFSLIVLLVLTARLVRYQWGLALGWVLQGVLVALGLVLPIMYVIGVGFAAIWTYCFLKGRQLDRAKTAHQTTSFKETP